MELENLTYSKKAGRRPLLEKSLPREVVSPSASELIKIAKPQQGYKKGAPILQPAIVYVLSGGENREKILFKSFMFNPLLKSCVQVLFTSKKGQGLQPYQMDEEWQRGRKSGRIVVEGEEYRLNSIDRVFLVTDVDEFEPQLKTIMKKKTDSDHGIWIISNPCIEIWLYYCFIKDLAPEVLKLRYVQRKYRSQKMKQVNHLLIPGGADPRKAFDNTETGILNSKSHFKTGNYGIPKIFATSFHIMMEDIMSFIDERGRSFAEYRELKRKSIEQFLSKFTI